jgi:hypothetical protein
MARFEAIEPGRAYAVDKAYAECLRGLTLSAGGATVFRFSQPVKRVKNLGWLLRNSRDVLRFYKLGTFMVAWLGKINPAGGYLCSAIYCCDWASESVMLEWLNRPVFRDVPATDYTGV